MNKVEVGTLDENELFEHRGIIYEVLYKTDFSFEPVTLGMFAHAYKLHCEECKAYEKRNENSQEVSRT